MTPMLGIMASSGVNALGDYESIQTVTVGAGGQASVTFSSITSTYKHLQIRAITKGNNTIPSQIDITFNSDTAANYSWHQLAGNGTSAFADNSINRNNIVGFNAVASSATNVFNSSVMDILDYSNTNKYKTTRNLTGYDNNGSGVVSLDSGSWRSTSAITSITFTARANLIGQYSSFALYGIR
jgi:hypothetical protein